MSYLMKSTRYFFLPLLLAWITSLAMAQSVATDEFNFSQIIGNLEFLERTDYPEKELGYSLRYENDKLLKADIYVYDNGQPNLKDGIASPEVKAEMASVASGLHTMEEMGKYEGVKELQQGEKMTKPSGLKFLWSRHSLRQIGGSEVIYLGKRISDTFLMVRKGKFIKIRITTKESDLAEHDKEIERFVNQVGSCLL
jgi:hypothetical protein